MPSSKSRRDRDDRASHKDDRKKEKQRDADEDSDASGRDEDRRQLDRGKRDKDRRTDHRRRKERKEDDEDDEKRKRRRRDRSDDEGDGDSDSENRKSRKRRRDRRKDKRRKKSSSRKRSSKSKKRRKKRSSSSSSSSSSSDDSDSSSDSSSDEKGGRVTTVKVPNKKLLAKLSARGETLEEYKERKNQKRAAKISTRFGYTAESNPFNDPNLHETFTWTKKQDKASKNPSAASKQKQNADTLEEIETIRRRRVERQQEQEEMERIKADEARMKELEHYDEWAKKEEEFHLQQQRQRSAIRLVEGREKPVDVLAKNLLLFGLTDEERTNQAAVKYKERYNALDELENVEAELEEPFKLLEVLKAEELRELLIDIDAFRALEKETFSGNPNNSIIRYWEALRIVACDEIKLLDHGENSAFAKKMEEIKAIFKGQTQPALTKMKGEVEERIKKMAASNDPSQATDGDPQYWRTVLDQLTVHLAKMELSDLHSKMLVRQLEKLEQKKEELTRKKAESGDGNNKDDDEQQRAEEQEERSMVPKNVAPDFGNLEEELGLTNEVDLGSGNIASWHEKYRPRKPRYFNRVKTGYDWNKYNQTHYDFDNPPPKSVQGYKFNIFYPDLVDPTKTPQFFLEPADSDDFCILRFHAGPPYEDVAFKIINREWNRSRKRGYRCTFERGVLSLYFNFTSHWYRR